MKIDLDKFDDYSRNVSPQVLQAMLLDQMFARLLQTTNEMKEMNEVNNA